MEFDQLSNRVLGAEIEVHRQLGPGLLESTYEACLLFELRQGGIAAEAQVSLPVLYKGARVETGYRIDLLVEKSLIVEIKALEQILPIHTAQLLTYLKLSGLRVGLLINFNVTLLKNGITRLVSGPQ
jgi:GxxExxY protein